MYICSSSCTYSVHYLLNCRPSPSELVDFHLANTSSKCDCSNHCTLSSSPSDFGSPVGYESGLGCPGNNYCCSSHCTKFVSHRCLVGDKTDCSGLGWSDCHSEDNSLSGCHGKSSASFLGYSSRVSPVSCSQPTHQQVGETSAVQQFCFGDSATQRYPLSVYCNVCSSYLCSHSPFVVVQDGAFKLTYHPDTVASTILPQESGNSEATAMWKTMSYNVETLHEDNKSFSSSPDRVLLCDYLNTLRVHIAAIQEARSNDVTKSLPGYVIVSSGADAHGNHGTEIWLTTEAIPVQIGAQSVQLKIDHNRTVVIYKDFRTLLLSFELDSTTFFVLNTHGPHQSYSKPERIAFWNHIFSELCKHVQNWRNLFWFGDFNLSFGITQSSAVGSAWPCKDRSTPVSNVIHSFLLDRNLAVPATFPEFGDGSPIHTYTHNSGSVHMIDHIVIHRDNLAYRCRSYACSYPNSIRDHRCVFLEFTTFIRGLGNCKRPTYDPQKFGMTDCSVKFKSEFLCASINAPFLNPTMQLHYYNTFLFSALLNHFPTDKAPKRKLHISDNSRLLMRERDEIRSNLKAASRAFSPNFVIQHWHSSFKNSVKAVRKSLRADCTERVSSICSEASAAAKNGCWKSVYVFQRMLCPSKRTSLCSIIDGDATYCSYKDIKNAFAIYFADILAGLEVDLTETIQSFHAEDQSVPSLFSDICDKVKDLMKGKGKNSAPGSDLLKYVVYYAFPFLIDRLQPVLDSANQCSPPLQWLISIVHPLYKGKGSPHFCPSYRDILLANCSGKLFRQVPRNALLPHLNAYSLNTMCGGILARGTDFCSQYIRVAKSLAKKKGSSLCILFADVVCAFASVLRDLVFSNRISDASIAAFFAKIGCRQAVFGEFVGIVRGLSAMDFANVPASLQKLVASLAGKSFFTMRGSTKFVDYTNGTGAGNPLADILFNFLIARVLRYIDVKLHDACLEYFSGPASQNNVFGIDISEVQPFSSTSYFDDGAFFIEHPDPQHCMDNSILVTAIVIDGFVIHGFVLNFKVGKTALMYKFRGHKSRDVHNSIYNSPNPRVPVYTRTMGLVYVFACLIYIHMGSRMSFDNSDSHESKARADSTMAAYRDTHRLCKNRNFSTPASLTVTKSLCLSRLVCNVGSCWEWNVAATKAFDTCYFKLFRRVYLKRSSEGNVVHVSHSELCYKYCLVPPDALRRKIRLRYFGRLLAKGPTSLWALLIAEYEFDSKSFLHSIVSDLHFLWRNVYSFRNLPDPNEEFQPWKSLICDLPGSFYKALDMQCDTESQLVLSTPAPQVVEHTHHICHICGSKQSSKQELSAHLFKKHGIKIPLRRKIDTTFCLSCMTEFHTRTKLINHIAYRCPACAFYYSNHVNELDSSITDPLDAQESVDNKSLRKQGKKILFHPVKSFRLFGPRQFNSFHST